MHVRKWQQLEGPCTASQADALDTDSALREMKGVLRVVSRHCDSILEGLGPMRQGIPVEYQSYGTRRLKLTEMGVI